jgi:hypothetical protein
MIDYNKLNVKYYILYKESDYVGHRGNKLEETHVLAVVLFDFNSPPPPQLSQLAGEGM